MPKLPNLFLFTTCQVGAETSLKQELARVWPAFRFAYSRPGFLTFKLPAGAVPPDDLDLGSVFARAYGFSLGKATGATREERIHQVWELAGTKKIERVHLWPRDLYEPGAHDYEPGQTDDARELATLVANAAPINPAEVAAASGALLPSGASADDIGRLALDVVVVDEGEWWVGFHRTRSMTSTWPGGLLPDALPADAVSRVYLKMLEAIRWSGFCVGPGQRVIEIGCAPGGASQVLLNLGASVVGVDPAEMHPLVMGHPRFRHIRRRSKEVPRREFLGADWLTCDINLPPNYTLDAIEAAVSYPGVRLQGMLLTLKLIDWSLAERIPEYLERVRSWGFRDVAARQLHHNRREICVAASDYRPPSPAAATRGNAKSSRRPGSRGPAAARKPNRRPKRTKPAPRGKSAGNP
jgi:23S rRNA (cytidine2498-2'-O)-methyltransferase